MELFFVGIDHGDFLRLVRQYSIATDAESASNLHKVLALERTTGIELSNTGGREGLNVYIGFLFLQRSLLKCSRHFMKPGKG